MDPILEFHSSKAVASVKSGIGVTEIYDLILRLAEQRKAEVKRELEMLEGEQ